jgi:hypothetical protein
VAGRPHAHLQDVVRLAGDAEAILDLGEVPDTVGEIVGLCRVERRDCDQRRDEQADRLGVDDGSVPADRAEALELANTVVHRRRGEPDALSDVGVGRPPIVLEGGDDLQVAFVEHGRIVRRRRTADARARSTPHSSDDSNRPASTDCRPSVGMMRLSRSDGPASPGPIGGEASP